MILSSNMMIAIRFTIEQMRRNREFLREYKERIQIIDRNHAETMKQLNANRAAHSSAQ